MIKNLTKCEVCPRKCKVNRANGNLGNCKASSTMEISNVSLHMFEEPCISGENGSGIIFFTHCNLHCIYCQNYEISQNLQKGKEVTAEELANIFMKTIEKEAIIAEIFNFFEFFQIFTFLELFYLYHPYKVLKLLVY